MINKKTDEIERYVNQLNLKLEPYLEADQDKQQESIFFSEVTTNKLPGDYYYSDGVNYYWGNIGDRGHVTIEQVDTIFELLYLIMKHRTSNFAFNYEKKHRISGQDIRRAAFTKQIELMGILGEEYKTRFIDEINRILISNPYRDDC